ncbi:MAG TPA: DUF1569 domain-containing protein [Acidobacteriaceae bacterium]|nr:DUF1569 domain-containing protein [Acidobacteriaceae bacterium]
MRSLVDGRHREEIVRRFQSLLRDDRRQWGRMSLPEMLCHVRGAFCLAMGEIERTGEAPPQPLPPRMLKFFALRVPMRWPRGIKTVPELEAGAPAMNALSFEQERRLALDEMDRFLQPGRRLVNHPMFGPMSYRDWMRWGYLHTDHHLRQFGR